MWTGGAPVSDNGVDFVSANAAAVQTYSEM